MSKLIIYNQSGYLYHICESVYNKLKPEFTTENETRIEISNCDSNYNFNDTDVYLSFMPFNKLNIEITPKKYIIYNFEQFTTNKVWSDAYINFLKNAWSEVKRKLIISFGSGKFITSFSRPKKTSAIRSEKGFNIDFAAAILFGSVSPNSYNLKEFPSLISAYILSNSFHKFPDLIPSENKHCINFSDLINFSDFFST